MAGRQVARRFGENLRRARKGAGLSQEELGVRASLHRTEIGLLERGERIPRIDTLVKLAARLGVRPEARCSKGSAGAPAGYDAPGAIHARPAEEPGRGVSGPSLVHPSKIQRIRPRMRPRPIPAPASNQVGGPRSCPEARSNPAE